MLLHCQKRLSLCVLSCVNRRFLSFGVETFVISALAATSTGVLTFLAKQRQTDRLRNEIGIREYQVRDLEGQISAAKSIETELKAATEEVGKKNLQVAELKSSYEKLEMLVETESTVRMKVEDELGKSRDQVKLLESHLADLNSKHLKETRHLAECQGRLESAQATVQLAKEHADREKEARNSLEKTIETSLKMNIERIREDLVAKTREVVGAGVVETLKSSLRQTPVLGRFGEIQLEYLLREYFTLGELKLYDEQITLDSKKRLDAVLKLPMNDGILHLIIDAKTPNIFHADSEGVSDSSVAVSQLRHRLSEVLTTLSKANYVDYYRRHLVARSSKSGEKTNDQVCDFVLMFLPMDYALLAIDEKLLRKCMDAKVIVCTPSLLSLQVEFIKMAWRQKLPSDAVAHVEEDFTILTDSLVRLTTDLEKCGSSLKMAITKAEKANSRLKNSVAGVFEKTMKGS